MDQIFYNIRDLYLVVITHTPSQEGGGGFIENAFARSAIMAEGFVKVALSLLLCPVSKLVQAKASHASAAS